MTDLDDLTDTIHADFDPLDPSRIETPDTPIVPPVDGDVMQWLSDLTREVAELRGRMLETHRIYEYEIQRLEARREHDLAPLRKRAEWLEGSLRAWHEDHPERRTIKLPYGTLSLTVRSKPSVSIDDADALLAWAKGNAPGLVETTVRERVPQKLLADAVRIHGDTAVTEAGEIVPGCVVREPANSWKLNTPEDDL